MITVSVIKQMENIARYNPDVISLSQGVPSMKSDIYIRDGVLRAVLDGEVDRYSDPAGILDLRKTISHRLQEQNMRYNEEETIITAGAVEAMAATLFSLFNPGDEILLPTPTYAAFSRLLSVARLEEIQLPLRLKNNWKIDMDYLKKKISIKTKGIILCHPNNPTGNLYSMDELIEICELGMKYNFYVILDEVYRNMLYDGATYYSPAVERKFREHIIRIVSFSKDFSITGWRIGFLHADKSISQKILSVHDTLVNCAPVVSQYAALSALHHEKRILADHLNIYKKNREYMGKELEKLSEYITFSWPEGSYFFFPRILSVTDSFSFCMDLLNKEKLALVPGIDFGKAGEGHVRLCFGREFENIVEGMKRLHHYFQQYA